MARDYEIAQILTSHRQQIPLFPKLVQLQLNEMTNKTSGIDEKNREIGSAAVELLGGKLHQRKLGISRPARVLFIKGSWKAKPR
ncbi:MAG: hypothetical protein ABI615_08380 [Chthoniobacterales bacterium]